MPEIIEDKCVGCGICANICPEGIEMADEKARIKNENADCLKDAANACPRDAIFVDGKNKVAGSETTRTGFNQEYGTGAGQGRGKGAGKGKGLGIGPRDGRGGGFGGGGKRKW
ncbi:hypothetical protein BEH94_06525 [Candidatus Altiarchaeales archaeon WOR_SM1_SCG]|nr:hypothetical protein BEH94_06525 [Candidatus Altiarchaeales archaeon WOR_SM1_SCG]ODS36828.1 MAG: hypothetical protein A7315_13935 [Candidatus Altiarchaeales archaeon WOR_SM1_79]ODS37711.1 MAG: hypothetical protein A7316_09150 [Candidatus Altiarchaeales archaeon WOR_SM1_86-2]